MTTFSCIINRRRCSDGVNLSQLTTPNGTRLTSTLVRTRKRYCRAIVSERTVSALTSWFIVARGIRVPQLVLTNLWWRPLGLFDAGSFRQLSVAPAFSDRCGHLADRIGRWLYALNALRSFSAFHRHASPSQRFEFALSLMPGFAPQIPETNTRPNTDDESRRASLHMRISNSRTDFQGRCFSFMITPFSKLPSDDRLEGARYARSCARLRRFSESHKWTVYLRHV